jgi:hypothetical protein
MPEGDRRREFYMPMSKCQLCCCCFLQADNVLLKMEMSGSAAAGAAAARPWRAANSSSSTINGSAACDQVVAKVADLGLACVLEEQDTHISGVHRVRARAAFLRAEV